MEKAIAERFVCTSHPKERPRTTTTRRIGGMDALPAGISETREPPEPDAAPRLFRRQTRPG
jgi:hypothetical protein